ncbi:type II secretion system protein [Candidatus Daviesbacteria bacterium]|nr:type II secretion system protein [Candidatus Daviesbacteria bacterium]
MNKKGFTLVELLVVITIIAILSVIGLTIFTKAQQATRDGKRKGDAEAIRVALEQYRSATGAYPCFATCGWAIASSLTALTSEYIAKIPDDPTAVTTCDSSTSPAPYLYASDGIVFTLYIKLENTNDASAQAVKGAPKHVNSSSSSDGYKTVTINSGAGSTCANEVYNYWVNSQQ